MQIRLGYVSTATSLWETTPSRTLTFKRYGELEKEKRMQRLYDVTRQNIANTLRILYYNSAHEINVYRLSSSIVPLATHPEVQWDFLTPFRTEWQGLGEWIKRHHMRVSFHPNQFTLFTSPNPSITANAVKDMEFHYKMLEAMGVHDHSFINIHVGGAYGDKSSATARFHENLTQLPIHVKRRMTLENDDKTYTTEETLTICQRERIPLAFDYHHHMANPGEMPLEELLPLVFETWDHTGIYPKIHISSPKSEKEFRSHADFVDIEFIMPLVQVLKVLKRDVDFMVEAKMKDQAMLKLIGDLAKIRGVKRIGGGTIELK
ncbi:UV DNA damage repair endonuclease UvsE [Bacillus sp. V59.32b]|uniref:UV DNA damage repair endonuclease UvsE n=1 Tax=Bacillus sp. V59.32b TaxID=1758642 RepID=UPI000E3B8AC0|nr:UV DNA damage repair endonuclease UvsE [Bacillus sp. V59.32b]RFU67989.1 UV DNA damage repair endonuclease UvsE [Bacillus sp. V59.32b]